MKKQIIIQSTTYNGIPCLTVRPDRTDQPVPTLLFYHGWGGSVESYRFFATLLAGWGYQVILPEPYRHGTRDPLDNFFTRDAYGHFWEVIHQSVDEARGILDDLIKRGEADPTHLAVAGSSMGGFIASGILAQNDDIKCLININGSPAWEVSEEIFRQNDGRPPMSDEERAEFRRLDPIGRLATIAPRPILHMHGKADSTISVEAARTFIQQATPFYASCPERLRLDEWPRVDHHMTFGMVEELFNWLDRYL